jgi:HAD superfamily hydrolase (TIGR01484 family)
MKLRPLREFAESERSRVQIVLTDIDDTLTDEGRLTGAAYSALEHLGAAGFIVIPVTGRPAGWCDLIARFWPVAGVVGENGAFYFRYDRVSRRMCRRYIRSEAERAGDRDRLATVEAEILAQVQGAGRAADQAYRESDLAIDYCEDVAALPRKSVEQIIRIFQRHGATAKVSSIHVNGWFGSFDKLSTSRLFLREALGIDMDAAASRIVYVGDSPNDAPMFDFFPNSIGVANVRKFLDRLPAEPHWVTDRPGGEGFVEVADILLAAR